MDNSCEPMDIDLSGNSFTAMDISYNKSVNESQQEPECIHVAPTYISISPKPDQPLHGNTQQPTNIKKFHINIQPKKNKMSFHYTSKSKIICTLVILFLSLITYHVLNIQCSDDINPVELKKILTLRLYGQPKAINSLIEALSVREQSKILFFYGGTGVGKTFTASMILEHIDKYSNVYHYTMPSFMSSFTTEFMIGLTVCKHTTVIVDDLSAKDDVSAHIQEVITKSQHLGKVITVILIYNCDNASDNLIKQCDENFPEIVLKSFDKLDTFNKLVRFEPLKEEHLKKCIEHELGDRILNHIDFKKILTNFNVNIDGCKGVYSKMKFLEI